MIILKNALWLAIIGSVLSSMPGGTQSARAAFVFTMQEAGGDVSVDGSGSINTGGVQLFSSTASPEVVASIAFLSGGPPGQQNIRYFTSVTGPTAFGPGMAHTPTSTSGDVVTITADLGGLHQGIFAVAVPSGYVSNASLSNAMTFVGETFASLGVTPGTYVWTWGDVADGTYDTLTVQIGPIPEPATMAMLAAPVVATWFARRRRSAI